MEGDQLHAEIVNCRMLLRARDDVQVATPEDILRVIIQYGDESVFPNLCVAIQLLLSIAVSIASC